ncbi:hypothetical protein HRbin36_00160 [bacterium HR36]|nr:hypothetical protein HRbin36_00160 [bacterium HR36]
MKRTLVTSITTLAFLLTALASQQLSPAGRPLPELAGKVLTIRQGGRPAEKFVTLRAWERPDGTILRYLRSEETNELATLVETPGQAQAHLYRWGVGRTQPPPGVPAIPETDSASPQRLPENLSQQATKPLVSSSTWSPATTKPTPAASAPAQPEVGIARLDPGLRTVSPGSGASKPVSTQVAPQSGESAPQSSRIASTASAFSKISQSTSSQGTSAFAPADTAWLRQLSEFDRVGGLVTLHFPDKGVHTCVILRKTVSPDGSVTLTVRSNTTGEVMMVTTGQVNAPAATLLSPPADASTVITLGSSASGGANTASLGLATAEHTITQPPKAEGVWSRLRRRLGLQSDPVFRPSGNRAGESYIPPPAPAPAPREVTHANSSVVAPSETRIVVAPVTPNLPANQSALGGSLLATTGAAQPLPVAQTFPQQPGAAPASGQPSPAERQGLFNRLFRRNSAAAERSRPPATAPAAPGQAIAEQRALWTAQLAQMFHLAAFLPPQRVTNPVLQPAVAFPPPLTAQPARPAPTLPDPLREPDKYVKHNPVRQEVTNAGLVAGTRNDKPSVAPATPGLAADSAAAQQRPGQTPPAVAKPGTTVPSTDTVNAPVPMPLVPLVTDKARPDAPPPQPRIQPFNTMQVAAVQNPHQFPQLAPPLVPSQPSAPATPVSWTRGPLIPPHQSPVSALALQSSQNGTEALALRNTLFLTNVLQASGSPQQREWAAARLAVIEPNRYPFAVEALVHAAKHDPHPAVRIKAIQSLALMRADTPNVRQALDLARRDADPRIREQANHALQLLGDANAPELFPAQYRPSDP